MWGNYKKLGRLPKNQIVNKKQEILMKILRHQNAYPLAPLGQKCKIEKPLQKARAQFVTILNPDFPCGHSPRLLTPKRIKSKNSTDIGTPTFTATLRETICIFYQMHTHAKYGMSMQWNMIQPYKGRKFCDMLPQVATVLSKVDSFSIPLMQHG